jgi:CheY-like chemotaxis protein
VLLAEDEEQVRKVAKRVLDYAGFDVTVVCNGAEALERIRSAPGEFDVVLSDIVMPEMDGIEFAVRARSEFPELRFVFMTGFSDLSKDMQRSRGLCEAILGKPFDIEELVSTLRHAAAAKSS